MTFCSTEMAARAAAQFKQAEHQLRVAKQELIDRFAIAISAEGFKECYDSSSYESMAAQVYLFAETLVAERQRRGLPELK